MKIVPFSTITAVGFVMLVSSFAHADDQQLAYRLAVNRAQSPSNTMQTTVAVYTGQRPSGQTTSNDQRDAESRPNPHSQHFATPIETR